MDGKVFISRQSRHFSFVNIVIEVLFPICTLTWRVNSYASRQGESINRGSENTLEIVLLVVALNNTLYLR